MQLELFQRHLYELSIRISPTASRTTWSHEYQCREFNTTAAKQVFLSTFDAAHPLEIHRLDPYLHPKLKDTRYRRVLVWESDSAYAIRTGENFEIEPRHLRFLGGE